MIIIKSIIPSEVKKFSEIIFLNEEKLNVYRTKISHFELIPKMKIRRAMRENASKANKTEITKAAPKMETFISNKICQFKGNFVFTDRTLNDSTISPIILSIPRHQSNNIQPKHEENINPENSGTASKPRRFLFNKENELKPNPTVIKKINISENQQNGDIESNTKNQISYHIHDNNEQNVTIEPNEKVDNNKTESDKESYEYEYESSQKEDNSVPPEYYENPNLMNKQIEINKNNLLEPLKLGTNAVFYIHVDPKNPKFVSSLENPEKEICKISRDGKMGSFSYKIILDDQVIATTTSNFSHNTFISVSDKNEISAVTFQKQDKQLKIKQFQAFIPAPGTSVPASDSSLLLKGDVAKIEMGPRPPKLKAGIPVLYFGGRVKKESVKNFILETHDDGCARLVFGKAADNRYVGEIYPPLTPLQAITIALSHFK